MKKNELIRLGNNLKAKLINREISRDQFRQELSSEKLTESEKKEVLNVITFAGVIYEDGSCTFHESDNSNFLAYVDSMVKDVEEDK